METTEKIVEAYVRYVLNWFTIPNIACPGQFEIDLLAIEVIPDGCINRYHIESGVSISGAYSKLTNKKYSLEDLHNRIKQAGQRRTLGYFIERKFGSQQVIDKLSEFGFIEGNYQKIIVSWGWGNGVEEEASDNNVKLWDFQDILRKISERSSKKTHFTDDTLRTLQLMTLASK